MGSAFSKFARGSLLVILPAASFAVVALTGYLVIWPIWQERQIAKSLADALYANDSDRMNKAIETLKKMNDGVRAVLVLVKSLKEGDDRVRKLSARTLGEFGPGAGEAVPHLIAAEADEDEEVRRLAANSLGKIGKSA